MSGPPKAQSAGDMLGAQVATGTAAAEASGNLSNQTTPFASLNYVVDPSTGKMTANQTYSPQEQALFNMFTGAGGIQPTALSGAGTALSQYNQNNPSGVPDLITGTNNLTKQMTGLATDAIMPNMSWMIQNNQNQLANQGLFESTNTDTPGNAADRSMQNMYAGLGQSIAGFQSQFMPQAFNMEQQAAYQDPLQYIQQMQQTGAPIGLNQVGSPTSNVAPASAVDASHEGYDQKSKQFGSEVGGIATLAGLFI